MTNFADVLFKKYISLYYNAARHLTQSTKNAKQKALES